MEPSHTDTLDNPIMQENQSIWPVVKQYGLFAALALIVHSLVGQLGEFTNPMSQGVVSTLYGLIVWPIFIIFGRQGILQQRLIENGFISFGRAFKVSISIIMFAVLISSVYGILYFQFIDPDFQQNIMDQMTNNFYEQGLSEEQIEQTLKISSFFANPFAIIGTGLVFTGIFGSILSLIMAAVLKRDPMTDDY